MKKRGQIQMSFGMIFSIIIIVAIIGVAIYFISGFLNLSECAKIGLFQDNLREEIEKAWKSRIYSDIFEGSLANGVNFLCFGDLNSYRGGFDSQYENLVQYRNQDKNFFIYPEKEKCSSSLNAFKIENVQKETFSCILATNNKVRVSIKKTQSESLVKVG